MDKRRMCPNCRAFITTDDKVCPYCNVEVGARAVDRRPNLDGDNFWTMVILLINVGLYAGTLLWTSKGSGQITLDPSGDALNNFGAKVPYWIVRGQWWRLITAGFLHGDIFHILINSYSLWSLAPAVESSFGTARFWTIYFFSTVGGFLASFYFVPYLSIGASAGVCGLIGAMIALGTRERHSIAGAMRGQFIMIMVINLVIGFYGGFNIDNAAHIGGFIGGFIAAYAAGLPSRTEWVETAWRGAALVTLGITLFSFFQMYLWLTRPAVF